jgi:hypothetical protein
MDIHVVEGHRRRCVPTTNCKAVLFTCLLKALLLLFFLDFLDEEVHTYAVEGTFEHLNVPMDLTDVAVVDFISSPLRIKLTLSAAHVDNRMTCACRRYFNMQEMIGDSPQTFLVELQLLRARLWSHAE